MDVNNFMKEFEEHKSLAQQSNLVSEASDTTSQISGITTDSKI